MEGVGDLLLVAIVIADERILIRMSVPSFCGVFRNVCFVMCEVAVRERKWDAGRTFLNECALLIGVSGFYSSPICT